MRVRESVALMYLLRAIRHKLKLCPKKRAGYRCRAEACIANAASNRHKGQARQGECRACLGSEVQLPAALNWLTTSCGILPRFESSMPLDAAQARIALLSIGVGEPALRLLERLPLTLRALLT